MTSNYLARWTVSIIGLIGSIVVFGQLLQVLNTRFIGPYTVALVGVTIGLTWFGFRSSTFADEWVFYGPDVNFNAQWHRLVTYGFVHADFWHLAFNMFTMWSFGVMAEQFLAVQFTGFGPAPFLIFYFAALIVSIIPTYLKHRRDSTYVSLGASGAVSAVLGYVVLTDPTVGVYVYFIPMDGWLFLLLFLAVSIYLGKRPGSRINHNAHVVGLLFGIAMSVIAGYLTDVNVPAQFIRYILN